MWNAQSGSRAGGIARLLRPGLVASIGANGLGQIFQALIQLVSVPFYAHALGLERYGVWLLFATLPAYLVVSDFGLTVASGNDMTARIAQNDRDGARTTFRALRRTMLALALAAGVLLPIVLRLIFPDLLAAAAPAIGGAPWAVLGLIVIYSFGVLHCGLSFAAFKAAGEYSVAAYRMQWIALIEAGAAMMMALAGLGLLGMAAALALFRTAGAGWLWSLLRTRHPFFFTGPVTSARARSRALMKPALAAFALPVSSLLVLQGSVALIGLLAGPAAVPAFAAIRTVTRLAIQLGMIVHNASLPAFTAAHARGEAARKLDLFGLSALAAMVTLIPAAFILIPLGPAIVGLWTQQRIAVPEALAFAMGISAIAQGLWLPLSNFLLAIDRQASFSWYYLGLAVLSLAVSAIALPRGGTEAVAWALAGLDLAMLFIVVWRSFQHGILTRSTLRDLRQRVPGFSR